MKHPRPMFYAVWAAVALLIILHQDNWLWDNPSLVFGFMPITLLYHLCISLAATLTWLVATRYAWPVDASPPPGSAESSAPKGGQA